MVLVLMAKYLMPLELPDTARRDRSGSLTTCWTKFGATFFSIAIESAATPSLWIRSLVTVALSAVQVTTIRSGYALRTRSVLGSQTRLPSLGRPVSSARSPTISLAAAPRSERKVVSVRVMSRLKFACVAVSTRCGSRCFIRAPRIARSVPPRLGVWFWSAASALPHAVTPAATRTTRATAAASPNRRPARPTGWAGVSRLQCMVVLTAGVPARNQPARPTREHPSDGRWCRNRGRPPSPRAPAASRGRRHLREPADLGELLRLDAGAADQGAVDVRLVHDVGDVGCLDRAAVEDAHPVGQVRRIGVPLRHPAAERADALLGIFGARRLARTDRPDRLVRDDDLVHLHRGEPVEGRVELRHRVRDVVTGLADVQALADAQDRRQPIGQGRLHLGVDDRVVIVVVRPPLRVPDHHVLAAELGQHPAGDVAGVGARGVWRQVLRAVPDQQLVPVDEGLHAADRDERRQDHHLDLGQLLLGEAERQLLHQRDRFEVGEVHLPVAGDQRPAHGHPFVRHQDSSASRPGRRLPSRYSRDAPPPVEMCPKDFSSSPRIRTAAEESPPPTTVKPSTAAIASATARVPAANGGSSNTPIGPFQNTVLAGRNASVKAATVRGPMSRPSRSAGIASAATTPESASAANRSAATMSTGSSIRSPPRSSSSRQVSTISASSRDLPTSYPRALRNVKHIPPPISSRSTLGKSASMTASLSETLAPPSTTMYGRSGLSTSRRSTSTSRSTSQPAKCGSSRGTSYTLACLRCRAPNASLT